MATATAPQTPFGAGEDFLQRLYQAPDGEKLKTCLQCGVCGASCPFGPATDYTPRQVIALLRAGMVDRALSSSAAWMCTSCFTCSLRCPAGIYLSDVLIPALREEVLASGDGATAELQKALESTLRYGNPLGESPRKRAAWTSQADVPVPILGRTRQPVDVLWFVECYPSYYPRNQAATRALARAFHALEVDFAILGPEEKCAGDCQRLAGESGLFEMLIEQNDKTFRQYHFNRIVTGDPHAYSAFINDYPRYGVNYPAQHYTQFLAQRLGDLRPLLKRELRYTVAYHDPCYLGRRNGEYEAPREVLGAIPGLKLVEMRHTRETALCCGGGGGGMWLDSYIWEHGGQRLSERRVREAVEAGADVLAVACPYELSRFEDAAKVAGLEGQLIVKEIAELLDEAMT